MQSAAKIRGSRAHRRLQRLGFQGSNARRAAGSRGCGGTGFSRMRAHRPWLPEPGKWLQYHFGAAPSLGGIDTVLLCERPAWSRFGQRTTDSRPTSDTWAITAGLRKE